MEYEIYVNLSHLMNLLGEVRGKRVTVTEMAKAAGCGRATLYRYIKQYDPTTTTVHAG